MGRLGLAILDVKLLRDARRLWGQLFAAAMVLAAGVSVLIMSGYLFSSLSATQDAYYDRYRFADVFASVRRAPLALERAIREIDGVRSATLRIEEHARLDLPNLVEPAAAQLVSVPSYGQPALNDLILSAGRWPTPGRLNEAIVSNEFAAAWGLKPGARLTAILNGQRQDINIVGIGQSPEFVYAIAPGELLPQHDRFAILWLARDSLEDAFDLEGAFNSVVVKLARGANEKAVIDALDDILDPYGGTGAFGRDDQLSHAFLTGEIDQNKIMGRILPPIFLAVAAFMLQVAIARLIDTEREQIGLMKAFGYPNAAVAGHYLKLAMIPGIAGGLIGAAFGTWCGEQVSLLYKDFYNLPFIVRAPPWRGYAIGVLVSLSVCLVGALFSVRKAVILDPAVAMRPPAPIKFRQGLVDTLGLMKLLSGPARIIARNLSRRPLRAGLTVIGVGAGCGTMIAGTFMYDAFERLMHIQFERVDRGDVTLNFPLEQPTRILFSIQSMPGVRSVQPIHSAPVELVNGSLKERLGLIGLPSEAPLYRPVDEAMAPVPVPKGGIVLSRYVAEELGLALGDPVQVKVLEGRRPEFSVPLAQMVDDYIGTAAYMDFEALARALKEAPSISSVHVRLDPAYYDAFFEEAKRSPIIQSTAIRHLVINEFRKTLNANTMIFTTIFYLFAGSICFGIVYNTARISLSERGRELASLRVIGFTRGEASYVLLGELAFLVLLALPLGCIFGWTIGWVMINTMFDADLVRPPFFITSARYANAIFWTSLFALISGLIVRRRIDELNLIEVLKTRE